ncbi:MAG: hypothetical protein OJF59_002242 [Cytophagales bacterium]|nr:MAG: hypothetical protein OJF59_002242 [Cytophagales bacterium]
MVLSEWTDFRPAIAGKSPKRDGLSQAGLETDSAVRAERAGRQKNF